MSATPDSTLANPEQLIADLRRQLAECKAERDEGLQRETATAEVLQVINSSPGDLAPVFDAIVEKAHALCDATQGSLQLWDGEMFRGVAMRGFSEAMVEVLRRGYSPGPNHPCRLLLDGQLISHCADMAAVDDPVTREGAKLSGIRTVLYVALRKDHVLLGQIVAGRQEVRPFTAKEIALVENFAAQAVIAMENARLLGELRGRTHDLEESLEYQTAISDVLRVISGSVFELEPILKTVVSTAIRLCRADEAVIFRSIDGEYRWAAGNGLAPEYERIEREVRIRPGTGTLVGRTALQGRTVHIRDAWADPLYEAKDDARVGGVHTMLGVPLMRDGQPIGVIGLARRRIEAYTDKEIGLVRTFADQAVIAMENARLLTETREALEQQTATAEVLQVINSSPGDLAPVFDAILEKAHSLCEAPCGSLQIFDGERLRAVATRGMPEAFTALLRRGFYPSAKRNEVVQGDFMELGRTPDNQVALAAAEIAGLRAMVSVPLQKDGSFLGRIVAARHDIRPFTDRQIALLQNFAAQAVIAMENARLLTETREALEQQTATAEVLQVINSSPGDLAPVFETILEKAHALCGAEIGSLTIYDGEENRAVATRGLASSLADALRQGFRPGPAHPIRKLLSGARIVQVPDVSESADPIARELFELAGIRTSLYVPLRKDDRLLGQIVASRLEVRLFSDKQIALLQNFAAQAVIAMENARLLTETREALEQQTATAEVLQVINSSPGTLRPVFDAMLEKAMRLCQAVCGHLYTYDGKRFSPAAVRGERGFSEWWEQHGAVRPRPGAGPLGRIAQGERVIVTDYLEDPAYRAIPQFKALVDAGGLRSAVAVALRKDDALLGSIHIYRQEVRPFTDKQIALLQSFAAQAVIAMENARLLTETREALDQQTATAEVLGVINSSPGNLQPVFDAMLEKALWLCEGGFGLLWTFDGECFHAAALRNLPAAMAEFAYRPYHPGPKSGLGRLARTKEIVHMADIAADEAYLSREPGPVATVELGGFHGYLAIPLLRDGAVVGAINVLRREVRPFTDKQIALLQNFAAQAVIAMENARLIDEIRQRQAELRVTFDNMGDGVVMFDEDLRLAAWNRNFQEMLDLPDAVLSTRPSYAEYLRILAERGEFGGGDIEGELSRRLTGTEQELRLERTRPDGKVIEVRRNAVPGGGFVLIYSDITERKEAEARLRAARDTAEGALRELRAAQASLIHAEKMASLGQLTAGIAHEIKNPLNFVNNFAGLSVELLDELKEATGPAVGSLDDDERADIDELVTTLSGNLEKIAEHGKRADGIVSSMLLHSRGGSGERRQVDLNVLVDEALNLAYHGARARDQNFDIVLDRDFDREARPIELVPQDVTRVLLNLIGNGFYAASTKRRAGPNGERAVLKVTTCDLGEAVEIRVRDNGAGIPPEIRDKLFQPFFTTKPTGEGTGLGLSISWDIVTQQHGGTIEVDSRVGEFTEFTVRLPRPSVGAPNEESPVSS